MTSLSKTFLWFICRPPIIASACEYEDTEWTIYNWNSERIPVNKNKFVCIFFVYWYLSISICFGSPWAHHQEIRLCLCDSWHLIFCMDDCLVCRVERKFRWLTNTNTVRKTVHLVGLFTRLHTDARSTKY